MSDENTSTAAPAVPTDVGQAGQPSDQQQRPSTDAASSVTGSVRDGVEGVSDNNGQETEALGGTQDQVSSTQHQPEKPTLPDGFTTDGFGRIYNAEGVECDANFDQKKDDVYYGSDNKPLDTSDATKMSPDPTNVKGGTTVAGVPIPVKFTEVRTSQSGQPYQYQYPEIRKDGKLMTHVLRYGHQVEQKLINCLFEDGTTKHVSEDELIASDVLKVN